MRLVVGHVWTEVFGDPPEIKALEQSLTQRRTVSRDEEEDYCHLRDGKFLSGLLPLVERHARSLRVDLEIDDRRSYADTPPLRDLPGIELRDYQTLSAQKSLAMRRGIIHVATGGGKSAILGAILYALQRPSIYVVPSVRLLEQTSSDFKRYGLQSVGRVGGGFEELDEEVLVGTAQTLYKATYQRESDLSQRLSSADVLVFDETHHLGSASWSAIGESCPAPYRYGCSGTPVRSYEDPEVSDNVLIGLTGERICYVPASYLRDRGFLSRAMMCLVDIRGRVNLWSNDWTKLYRQGIVRHEYRNRTIADLAVQMKSHGHKVLIIVTQLEHGESLLKTLHAAGESSVRFSYGGESVRTYNGSSFDEDEESAEEFRSRVDQSGPMIEVGSPVMDEGVDLPSISCVIIAAAGKSPIKTLQRVGRGLRLSGSDPRVWIFDFVDHQHPILRHHSKVRRGYYEREEFDVFDSAQTITKELGWALKLPDPGRLPPSP